MSGFEASQGRIAGRGGNQAEYYQHSPPPSSVFYSSNNMAPDTYIHPQGYHPSTGVNSNISDYSSPIVLQEPVFVYPTRKVILVPQVHPINSLPQPHYPPPPHPAPYYHPNPRLKYSHLPPPQPHVTPTQPLPHPYPHKINSQIPPVYQPPKQPLSRSITNPDPREQSFGNQHNLKIMKIIQHKEREDRVNEEILIKFRREAEEFKRMRSEQKRRFRSLAGREKWIDPRVFYLPPIQGEEGRGYESQEVKGLESDVVLNPEERSVVQSIPDCFPEFETTSIIQQSLDTSLHQFTPSPSSKNLRTHPNILLPITDSGQDGLKYIRKNLFSRKNKENNERRSGSSDLQDKYEEKMEELKEDLRGISKIIRSKNLSFRRSVRRARTDNKESREESVVNEFLDVGGEETAKDDEKLKSIEVKMPSIRVNLSRTKKPQKYATIDPHSSSTIMKLSEIFN